MIDLRAPREILGETLAQAAEKDPKLVVLDADLGRSTRLTPFEERYPERYLQMGVAEQNAVGVASGLVYAGFHPVFVTFTMFAIGLPWTQLRQTAYAGLPIKIIATHPGFDIGPDGGTHQMLADLALSRVIPGLVVLSPCDTPETVAAISAALESERMTYVRVGRQPVPDLHDQVKVFPIGEAEVLHDGGEEVDVLLVADGSMAWTALQSVLRLEKAGIGATVVNVRTIKPLDKKTLVELSGKAEVTVTIENHSILGGMGGAVAEVLGEQGRTVIRLGAPDVFGETGTTDELRALYHLDVEGVLQSIKNAL